MQNATDLFQYKILLVDDRSENLVSLAYILNNAGYQTESALTSNEALKVLLKSNFGLAILDVQMPGMNGFELAELIKGYSKTRDMPIIFLSANAIDKEYFAKGHSVGGLDYLTKPIDEAVLLLKVRNFLQLYHVNQKLGNANKILEKMALYAQISYHDLYYSLPQDVFLINKDGNVININRDGKLKCGLVAKDVINRHYSKSVFLEKILNTNESKGDISYFFKNIADLKRNDLKIINDGEDSIFCESEISIVAIGGEPHIQISVNDVTEKNKAMIELIKSEDKFKSVLQTAQDSILLVDNNSNIIFWNAYAEKTFGYTEEEIIGLPLTTIIPNELKALHAESFIKHSTATESTYSNKLKECIGLRKDGSHVNIELTISFWKSEGKNIYCGIIRDITQRKQNEFALLESEAMNRGILSAVPCGIVVVNEGGIVIECNVGWKKLINDLKLNYFNKVEIGVNYFDICNEAIENGKSNVERILKGLHGIFLNRKEIFDIELELGTGENKKWIQVTITCYQTEGVKAVIRHIDITNIKRAELMLQETNKQYKTILDSIDEMISYSDANGKILWANNSFKKNLLYDDEEIKKLKLTDILCEDSRRGFHDRFGLIKIGQVMNNLPATYITKNGLKIDVVGTVIPYMEGEEFVASQGFFRNISEINKERKERKKAENRLQKIFDSSYTGYMVVDFNWRYLYANETAKEHINYTDNNIEEKSLLEIIPHIESTSAFSKLEKCMFKREHLHIEAPVTFQNGVEKWLYFQAEPVDEGIFIMTNDITEKKQSRLKIQKQQKLLATAEEITHIGSWEHDVINNSVIWSDGISKIFEFDNNSIQPSFDAIRDMVHPEDRKMLHTMHVNSILNKTSCSFVYKVLLPSKQTKYIQAYIDHQFDEFGKHISSIGTLKDITKEHEANRKLESQNQELKKINSELDRFVYSTSHDLRAPLMSLSGLVDLFEPTADYDELNLYRGMMKKSIDRVDRTIRDILLYSRNSRMYIANEQIDFRLIFNELIDSISYLDGIEKISFLSIIEDKIPFMSDRLRVIAIVNNLVTNAIKYHRKEEPNKFVKFSFTSFEDYGIINVEDNGEGIEEYKLGKIFEMFYRGHEKSDGSGLGLYICKEIVDKMKGKISVQSELGKGTTFTIVLPNSTNESTNE